MRFVTVKGGVTMCKLLICDDCGKEISDDRFRIIVVDDSNTVKKTKQFDMCKKCFHNKQLKFLKRRQKLLDAIAKGIKNA